MKNLVNEELNKMKYLLGYQRGMVISEQDAPAATAKDVIKQIQRILVDKYKVDLGKTGDTGDGVDGDWGNLTQSALEKVVATKNARKEQSQQSVPDATKNVMPSTEISSAATAAAPTPGGQYGGVPAAATITTAPSAASAAAPVATTPAAGTTPAAAESPADLYTRLVKGGLLSGRLNGKRAVYKGPDLSQEDSQKLQSYLGQQGYRLSRENNDYSAGDKLVFKKD